MLIQPKPYIEKVRLRNQANGIERRRNMSKLILENGTPLPKPIEYSDIDKAMYEWVEEHTNIVYDGRKLPTYKLYSTQRLSEYLQEWDKVDEIGNPIINFKTLTRDNNPQKGENQGNYFNIPGHKDFAMFYVPVLQENGTEAYDKYTMKQPFQVNFTYSLSIVANKMEIINEMNELMHYEFSAINSYISPNGHPMSMTLEDVSDNSEYAIDDRKYYSQTYKIKVRGYIIRKEDFKIERIPSRILMPWRDSDATGVIHRRGKNVKDEDRVTFINFTNEEKQEFMLNGFKNDKRCDAPNLFNKEEKPSDMLEEVQDTTACCNDSDDRYYNKVMKVIMKFDCTTEVEFVIDKDMVLLSVETNNVKDFDIFVNGEIMNLDMDVNFYDGDTIKVKIERDDLYNNISEVALNGYDPHSIIDSMDGAEVSIDEPIGEEYIFIGGDDEE